MAQEFHADSGKKTNSYDIFSDLRRTTQTLTSSISTITDYTYDKLSQLTRIDRPVRTDGSRAFETWQYDQQGNRISHTDALNLTDKTYYDSLGRVTQTTSAANRLTTYTYSYLNTIRTLGTLISGGYRRTTTNTNYGTSDTTDGTGILIDDLDLQGRVMNHTDMGGHTFTYNYNYAGLVSSQTGSTGQNISYSYYGNGYLRRTVDSGVNSTATYEYDANGNRTFEGIIASGGSISFQQSNVTYDALNRVIKIDDPKYTVQYEYDAVGNRRRVFTQYKDAITGTTQNQDYWYAYDAMNRFTITMGQLNGGQRSTSETNTSISVIRGNSGDGVSLTYDQTGQRTSATYASDNRTETYSYTADGYLTDTNVTRSGTTSLMSRRINDLQGRVTAYSIWDNGTKTTDVTRNWDNDNLLVNESNLIQNYTSYYTYYNDGTLKQVYAATTTNPTTTTYTYEWWDGAKQKEIKIDAGWAPGFSRFAYDVNGHVKTAFDQGDPNQANTARAFTYWTDGDGQILRRDELLGGTFNASTGNVTGAQSNRLHMYYYLAGHRIGNVGNDGIDRIDYAQELAAAKNAGQRPGDAFKRFRPASSADFDENYQPINSEYPGSTASIYTVRTGETLRSIAQAMWGDGDMWYLIADANGMTGADQLKAGQRLSIPNKVTNIHNNSTTYKPYDAGKALGDTNPTLPDAPPPPGKGGCGGAAMIIAIIVIVVAVVTQQYYLVNYGTAVGTGTGSVALGASVTTSTVAAGTTVAGTVAAGAATWSATSMAVGMAIGGAAGSVVGQLAGMALGTQDKFSWSQVGLAAVGGAITGGLSRSFTGLGNLGGAVARGVAANSLTQGVAIAAGMQKKFDWRSVAASGVAAAVGYGVGDKLKNPNSNFTRFATSLSSGVASAAVRGNLNGNNLAYLAADVVGSTIGNMFADSMKSETTSTSNQTTSNEKVSSDTSNSSWNVNAAIDEQSGTVISDADYDSTIEGDTAFLFSRKQRSDLTSDLKNSGRSTSAKAALDFMDTLIANGGGGTIEEFRAEINAASDQDKSKIIDKWTAISKSNDDLVVELAAQDKISAEQLKGAEAMFWGVNNSSDSHALFNYQRSDLIKYRSVVESSVPLNAMNTFIAQARGAVEYNTVRRQHADWTDSQISNEVLKRMNVSQIAPELVGAAGALATRGGTFGRSASPLVHAKIGMEAARRTGQLGELGPVDRLLYGARVGEGLPGAAGTSIANRPTPAQLEALTVKHNVEFAVVYKLGQSSNGKGGQYYLYSGETSTVQVPLSKDSILIYHTHPGGTAWASSGDMKVMGALERLGSPQRSSQIVPVGKDVIRFSKDNPRFK